LKQSSGKQIPVHSRVFGGRAGKRILLVPGRPIDKHKALWKFFVLIDRSASDKQDALARAAAEYSGMDGDSLT
jgi:hypothetical protein